MLNCRFGAKHYSDQRMQVLFSACQLRGECRKHGANKKLREQDKRIRPHVTIYISKLRCR